MQRIEACGIVAIICTNNTSELIDLLTEKVRQLVKVVQVAKNQSTIEHVLR